MQLVPAKTPGFIKTLFPKFIWNINTKKKEIFLTFDDGPTPEITPWVLEQLKHYNAKATFFCIGSNIEKHPELFEQIITEGHSIGNHTYKHLKGWKHKTKVYLEDVEKAQNLIHSKSQNISVSLNKYISQAKYRLQSDVEMRRTVSNTDPQITLKLFRPPYGKLKNKQAKQLQKLGYKIIMWNVLSFDWDVKVSEKKCLKNITNAAKKGSIIVMHDSQKASRNLKAVLPKVLKHYSEIGFEFNSI